MGSLRDKMDRAAATGRVEAEAAKKRYNESSQKRLLRILEKKLQTSFIGALSQFEQFFGHLWGHRRDESELTPEQLEMRDKWNQARTFILNNGNNQIRAIQSELSQYTVSWNRFHYDMTLPVPPSKDQDNNRLIESYEKHTEEDDLNGGNR